jgi:hypothetical protein
MTHPAPRKVPCEFESCPARIELHAFDEDAWLPVFKSTREHLGFFCPHHVGLARAGELAPRYLLSRVESGEEIVIDRKPLVPETAHPAES